MLASHRSWRLDTLARSKPELYLKEDGHCGFGLFIVCCTCSHCAVHGLIRHLTQRDQGLSTLTLALHFISGVQKNSSRVSNQDNSEQFFKEYLYLLKAYYREHNIRVETHKKSVLFFFCNIQI